LNLIRFLSAQLSAYPGHAEWSHRWAAPSRQYLPAAGWV